MRAVFALGGVIETLAKMKIRGVRSVGSPAAHVPYRDSKLTRLLQSSLSGDCKTTFLVTIHPNACHIDETLVTLRLAQVTAHVLVCT